MKTKLFLVLFCLLAYRAVAGGITVVSPKNEQVSPVFSVTFSWNKVLNYDTYRIKFSTSSDMSGAFMDMVVTGTSSTVSFNTIFSRIYWQVVTTNAKGYYSSDIQALNFINPVQDPNLLLWYAADTGMVLAPDSTILTWKNLVTGGPDAVQANAGSRPRLTVNVPELAGKSTVYFDGDDVFRINSGGQVGGAVFLGNFTAPSGSAFPDYNAVLTRQGISNFDDYILTYVVGTSKYEASGYFGNNTLVNNVLSNDFAPLTKYKTMSGYRTRGINTVANFGFGAEAASYRFWTGNISELIVSKINSPTELDSLNKYLFNKYSPPVSLGPDIVTGTSFSDPVTLSVPNRFATYLWSSGSISNSASVLSGGRYTIKTKDIFGVNSEDDIEVYPYRRLGNRDVFLCAGDSLVLNLGITSPFTFLWSTGSTANTIVIKTAGQYTVQITDFKGQSVRDTLNVFIDNPVLSPNPSGSSLSLCQDEKLFAITQTAYDSLRWSTGSTAAFITISSPGPYGVYGRTTAGCILNKNFNVTIAGQAPAANFETGVACQQYATAFTDVSTFPVGNTITAWKWNFGDGNSSTSSAPENQYANTGSYSASLKVTTNAGCSDSIVKTVTVRKRPKADFFNLLSCSNKSTTFVDNSIANSDSLIAWSWNFAGLGTSNLKNPGFTYPSAAIYNTLLEVTNSFGCKDTATRQTIVSPSPVANFRADSACSGTNTIFTNLSTVQAPSVLTNYFWDYGDETQSIQVSQPHLYPTYGQYNVRLSIRSSNQCVDTIIKTVRVFANPDVDFALSNTQCVGKDIRFEDISTTVDGSLLNNWQWYFSGQGTSNEQDPEFAFTEQGNYTIQLTARTAAGCAGTKFRSIAVTSPPQVNFSFTPNYGPPPLNVSYTNLSPSGGNYIWDYGDGSPTYQGFTPPAHNYTVRGTFPIKLLATDFKGCSDSLVRDILVDNAFVDGVMVTVNVVPNGDYYKVVATVLNNSNIEVTSLGITVRLANGSEVREIWTGSLKPGQTVVYPFIGQLRYNANGDIPVICATIESVNVNATENDLSNNTTCEEITVGQFDVLTVFPNPATDNVNFGVMLPEDGGVEITLYDMVGKLLYSYNFDGVTGYNNLRMPVLVLNGSVYIAEVKFKDKVVRRKVMRGNRN